MVRLAEPIPPRYHTPQEEIGFGPACWLWDYLRRSGAKGYFLPLSGGAVSAATASICGIMCHMVCEMCDAGDEIVLGDVRRIIGDPPDSTYVPRDAQELAGHLIHTSYLGTANSSSATRDRARGLAAEMGLYHKEMEIDPIVSAFTSCFTKTFPDDEPNFEINGGSSSRAFGVKWIIRLGVVCYLSQHGHSDRVDVHLLLIRWDVAHTLHALHLSTDNRDDIYLFQKYLFNKK